MIKLVSSYIVGLRANLHEGKQKIKMDIAVKTLFVGLNPRIISHHRQIDVSISKICCRSAYIRSQARPEIWRRRKQRCRSAAFAVLSGAEDVISSSQFEGFSFATTRTDKARELKISIEVSGVKTRAIFDEIFEKMVAAAQPIPGFRRVKGGKTPNIPREILLEILGPSRVYKEVIKTVINSAVAEYVQKENLKASKDLRVEQSFEELEDVFEPDKEFGFDAVIRLQETK